MLTFAMMVGIPGSGKTTFANKYGEENDAVVISSDEMREQLFGDANDQSHNDILFEEIHNTIVNCLRCNQSVVFDATNINRKHRTAILRRVARIDCKKICFVMATPFEECIKNNKSRDRLVPEEVIKHMYERWQTPADFEGWDRIELVYNKDSYKNMYGSPKDLVLKTIDFDQHNKHHSKKLGDHLADTAKRVRMMAPEDEDLVYAALIHDIGKPYTQTFANEKEAHYYSHHNVGAYDAMFIEFPRYIDKLDVSLLVCLHMEPYFWDSIKTADKKKNEWGEDLFNRIMILNGADQMEH